MSIELIILITTMAITAGLFTTWYLTQIRNTMVRLTSETTKYRELANAAEAQMTAEREVRELRQLNDELESKAYDFKLGEAMAREDNVKLQQDLDTATVRRNELAVRLKNLESAYTEKSDDYDRVCRQFAEHKEEANQDFNGQKHRENQLIKDNEKLKNQLFCKTDSNKTLRRVIENLKEEKKELLSELSSMGMNLNSAEVKTRQLTDELTETKEELRSKRLQLDRTHKLNEQLHAELDDWENEDDGTDLTPNNPNFSKHPNWHKNKAQGIKRVHWHTVASASRAHLEAMFMKANYNKNITKAEIKRRYRLAQEGINTLEAGRKK